MRILLLFAENPVHFQTGKREPFTAVSPGLWPLAA